MWIVHDRTPVSIVTSSGPGGKHLKCHVTPESASCRVMVPFPTRDGGPPIPPEGHSSPWGLSFSNVFVNTPSLGPIYFWFSLYICVSRESVVR